MLTKDKNGSLESYPRINRSLDLLFLVIIVMGCFRNLKRLTDIKLNSQTGILIYLANSSIRSVLLIPSGISLGIAAMQVKQVNFGFSFPLKNKLRGLNKMNLLHTSKQ